MEVLSGFFREQSFGPPALPKVFGQMVFSPMVNPTVNPMRVLTGSFMEQFLDPLAQWIKFFPPMLKGWRQPQVQEAKQHPGCGGCPQMKSNPLGCLWHQWSTLPQPDKLTELGQSAQTLQAFRTVWLYPGHLLFRLGRSRRSFSSACEHQLYLQLSPRRKARSFKSPFCFQGQWSKTGSQKCPGIRKG